MSFNPDDHEPVEVEHELLCRTCLVPFPCSANQAVAGRLYARVLEEQ